MATIKLKVPEFDSVNKAYRMYVKEIQFWKSISKLDEKEKAVVLAYQLPDDDPSGVKEKLFELLLKQKESYEKELEIIEKVTKEKESKKNKAAEKYQEELEKIEKEHNLKLEDLEEEKRAELVETIEKNAGSSDKLAEEIAKILNAKFFEKE